MTNTAINVSVHEKTYLFGSKVSLAAYISVTFDENETDSYYPSQTFLANT